MREVPAATKMMRRMGCIRITNFQIIRQALEKAVPSVAIPPLPLLASKFSALIDRVCAAERRDKFPSDIPSPLNIVSLLIDSLNTRSLD